MTSVDVDSGSAMRLAMTDGGIAVVNLQSARQRSWNRFWRAPEQPGLAELIVEQEQLTSQFLGDLAAFDRLETLAHELGRAEPEAGRTLLVAAQVACATHRFSEARASAEQARKRGADADALHRLTLSIDQATGENLTSVLAARRERVACSGSWSERVPLGALLADLGEFEEAEKIYVEALREYPDVSPFAPAWVCFQLGVLWGETVPAPQADQAARWYRDAIALLPCFAKARVHLAEICLERGETPEARDLLMPVLECGDPEVTWRLADVAQAFGDDAQANGLLSAARVGFEALLSKHPLAFADHGAEFYAGSGGDLRRAQELARLNFVNRPTRRAFEQAHATALAAGDRRAVEMLLVGNRDHCGLQEHAHART